MVAIDLNVYVWTHDVTGIVEALYEVYIVKNITFVRNLFEGTLLKKAGREPTANETAKLISRKLSRRSDFGKAPVVGTNVVSYSFAFKGLYDHRF